MHRKAFALVLTFFPLGLLNLQCSVPVLDLYESFSIQVLDQQNNDDPVKIDFVWVIDNSNSMCEEQSVLSKNFETFAEQLQSFITIDARMAVVTTNVLTEQSKFSNTPASAFPPPCRREVIKKCLNHDHCLQDAPDSGALPLLGGESYWSCTWVNKEDPSVVNFDDANTLVNGNGSVNSRCQLVCTNDEVCQDNLGEDLLCKQYNPELKLDNGCMVPPPTEDCPANLPKYLELNSNVSNIEQFHCLATVGANSGFNANLEQGLNAARYALDPNGPNSGQAKDFLRKDAWLVLIYISDEDDCSLTHDCLLRFGKCCEKIDGIWEPDSNDTYENESSCEDTCTQEATADGIPATEAKNECKKAWLCSETSAPGGEWWIWNDIDYIKANCLLREQYPRCAQLGDIYGEGAWKLNNCATDDQCTTTEDDECCKSLVGGVCTKPALDNPATEEDESETGHCTSPKYPPNEGPLEPVSRLVNFLKSLKDDPARVLVASIVGDSQEIEPELRSADIQSFHFSEANPGHYAPRTFICSSENGIADYGSRYIDLAEAFGPNGIVANICGPASCSDTSQCPPGAICAFAPNGECEVVPEGLDLATYGTAKALDLISETIIRRVVRICLPRPLKCKNQEMYCTSGCADGPCGTFESCVAAAGEWIEGPCLEYADLIVQRTQCVETDVDNPGKCVVKSEPTDLVQTSDTVPGPGEYKIQDDGTCETTGLAVFFGDLLDPLDSVLVQYEGGTGSPVE